MSAHTQLHYITQCVRSVDQLLPAGRLPIAGHCLPAARDRTPVGSIGSEQTPRVQLYRLEKVHGSEGDHKKQSTGSSL